MAHDLEDRNSIRKLASAVEASINRLKPLRERTETLKRQFVGRDYGDGGSPAHVPINLIEMGVTTFQRYLASHLPNVRIRTRYRELLPSARNLELAINQESDRLMLSDRFAEWVIEALFRVGVLTLGLDMETGRLFCDCVPFSRLILDMSADSWDEQGYIGHDFRVPRDWVVQNEGFDARLREDLSSNRPLRDSLGVLEPRNALDAVEEFDETITLRQIYLPRHKVVATFLADQMNAGALRISEWRGPERGPYHVLGFGRVPGSLLFNAPVPHWASLHDIVNTLWAKSATQSRGLKQLLLVRGSAANDGKRIVEARDGQSLIYCDDPNAAHEYTVGGPDQRLVNMVMMSIRMWDMMAGNMSSLAGLRALTGTVGQEEIVHSAATGRLQDMQLAMLAAQKRLYEDIGWWIWHDETSDYHLIKMVEGTDYMVPGATWRPEDRQGVYNDYNFDITPYSAKPSGPGEEAEEFTRTLMMLAQATPLMANQQMAIDWEMAIKHLAKLKNMPDLERMVKYIEGETQPSGVPVVKPMAPESPPAPTMRSRVADSLQRMVEDSFGMETNGRAV